MGHPPFGVAVWRLVVEVVPGPPSLTEMRASAPLFLTVKRMTTAQVIRWWELRRLLYNLVLLITGVATIAGMEWLMNKAVPLGEDAIEPMALVLFTGLYGIAANVCYTLGWISELVSRRRNPERARVLGRRLFRWGLIFSCALTTLPFWYACVFWAAHRGHSR